MNNDFNNSSISLENDFGNYCSDIESMYLQEAKKYRLLSQGETKKALEIIEKYRDIIKKYHLSYESLSTILNKLPEFSNESVELSKENIKTYLDLITTKVSSLNELDKDILIKKIKITYLYYKYYDLLINHNLRLVISTVYKYSGYNTSFLDLIQAGNLGLMHALDKFDTSYNTKFSTYAVFWINQKIREFSIGNSLIKQTHTFFFKQSLYESARKELEDSNTILTIENIYKKYIDLYTSKKCASNDPKEIAEFKESLMYFHPKEEIVEIERAIKLMNLSSLDVTMKKDDNETLIEFIPAETNTPEEEYLHEDRIETIKKVLSSTRYNFYNVEEPTFSINEKIVLCLKYGLKLSTYLKESELITFINEKPKVNAKELWKLYLSDFPEPYSHTEISKILGVSRQRCQQVEEKSIPKLRKLVKNQYDNII